MKTLLIVCLTLFFIDKTFGQIYVDGIAIDTLNTPFCQLICTNAVSLNKAQVQIDYGQRYVDNGFNRQKISNSSNKDIRFNSSIDALNFMTRNGWELVSFQTKENQFIYLLRWKKSEK
ncbi:hypothetical protein GCM10028805_24770 [Spirosoma harenae]